MYTHIYLLPPTVPRNKNPRFTRSQPKTFAPYKRPGEKREESEWILAKKLHEKLSEFEEAYANALANNNPEFIAAIATGYLHRFEEVEAVYEEWCRACNKKTDAFEDRFENLKGNLESKQVKNKSQEVVQQTNDHQRTEPQITVQHKTAQQQRTGQEQPTTKKPQEDELEKQRAELRAEQQKLEQQRREFEEEQKNWNLLVGDDSTNIATEVTVDNCEQEVGDLGIAKLWSDEKMED